MRFGLAFFFALVGAVIGWFGHAYLSAPPETAGLDVAEPVDLREYHTHGPSPRADSVASASDQLQRYLQAKNYIDAIAYHTQSLGSASRQVSSDQRLTILEYADKLYREQAYHDALSLLNVYLESNHRDVDALRLKARILAVQRNYKQQIEVLYQARAYAYQERDIAELTDAIRSSVDKYKQVLLNLENHVELLSFFQELVYLEPDYSPYFIELAKAQLKNNLDNDAFQSLGLVVHDPLVGAQAQQLLDELSVSTQSDEEPVALSDGTLDIPLRRRGNHFVVEATLNNRTRLSLLIDTGASITVVKPERLRDAVDSNLDRYPEQLFNTANGIVTAPVLNVASLVIGEFEVTNLRVGGLQLINTSEVDGLLGMNFLRHFRFFIDQERNLLRLSLSD